MKVAASISKIAVSKKGLSSIILVIAVLMALYHLANAFILIHGSTIYLASHMTFFLALGLLIKFRDGTGVRRYLALGCLPIAMACMAYIFANSTRLEGSFGFITDLDLAVGIALVSVMLILCWLYWGIAIPLMIGVFIAYFLWGHLLPGYLYHPYFNLKYVVSSMGIALTTGIFGSLLVTSASTIIYFMMFGAIMEVMGVTPAFIEMGKWVGRRLRGGPAYMALVGSSMVSMINGSGTSNVAITGTFTIPAMKAAGFKPVHAGAVECVSSSGGPITPPVMGAAGFMMAAFIGVPYFVIIQKAIIGAILFYLSAFIGILFFCYSTKKPHYTGDISGKTILRRLPIFIAGLGVVLVMMMQSYSVGLASASTIIVVIVLGMLLLPETRSPMNVINGLAKGAIWGAEIGIVLSAIGMMATTVIATGLAPKGTAALLSLTGGALVPSLMLVGVVGILLGMGVPISAAYSILALMLVPALLKLGVDMFAAHFFALYYSAWSIFTPPYAPAAMVASKISGGSYFRTAWVATSWMLVCIIFPFVLALHPSLLNFPASITLTQVTIMLLLLVASVGLAIAFWGWFISKTNAFGRLLGLVNAFGVLAYIAGYGYLPLIVGLGSLVVLAPIQLRALLSTRRQAAAEAAGQRG